jgi:type II secretory pathway pseudopilin PulG
LIVVLLIIGVLAALVSVNIVGLLGHGRAESYAADLKTIQLGVSAFYADSHAYSKTGGWNEVGNYTSVHNYPTKTGEGYDIYLGTEVVVGKYKVNIIIDGNDGTPATTADIVAAAIWMGLLTNSPGDGSPGPDKPPPQDSRPYLNAPLKGEAGPYLNPLPQSCSEYNVYNGKGSIIWIMGEYGRVYGVFESGGNWYAGFGGKYP